METLAHGVAGSLGGAMAMAVLYPLDQIKTIQQLRTQEQELEQAARAKTKTEQEEDFDQEQEEKEEDAEEEEDRDQVKEKEREEEDARSKSTVLSMSRFVRDAMAILSEQKWRIYRGFASTQLAMGSSNFTYFFCYNGLKNGLLKRLRMQDPVRYPANSSVISPLQNLALSCVAGIMNVYITAPVWVANMRLKSKEADKYNGFFDCLRQIAQKEGIKSLWSGTAASLVLVSNPVIHYVSYERMKTALMLRHQRLHPERVSAPSSWEIFTIGALAKFITTMATYPLQVVQSRMRLQERQAAQDLENYRRDGTPIPKRKGGVFACLHDIYSKDGLSGLYAGVEAKLLQTVLTAALMLVTYEKLLALIMTVLKAQKKKLPYESVVGRAKA